MLICMRKVEHYELAKQFKTKIEQKLFLHVWQGTNRGIFKHMINELYKYCLLVFTVLFGTLQDAKVMSWWDYGYQITAMANRTILVDNNTWNNTHISRVGQVIVLYSHSCNIMIFWLTSKVIIPLLCIFFILSLKHLCMLVNYTYIYIWIISN